MFKSDGTSFTPSLGWASGPGNWEWSRSKITSGDFNGDGRCDLAVLYDYGNAATALWMFSSNGSSFAPSLWWASGPGNWEWSRSKIAAGDFNGDGRDDLGVFYD